MHDKSVLDGEVVSELKEIMGKDFRMLVESFQRDSENRLIAIEEALAAGDHATLRSQAHSFKGSSGNLGAFQLADLCTQLETQAIAGELADAPALFESLKQQFQQANAALHASLT